ncbi:MAG: hypothetical protein GF329_12365 [Candidatus Lokiarchaeota archaeon]|nr:hypothetical protein [Candidatus Lokiarchaeota archaeon]
MDYSPFNSSNKIGKKGNLRNGMVERKMKSYNMQCKMEESKSYIVPGLDFGIRNFAVISIARCRLSGNGHWCNLNKEIVEMKMHKYFIDQKKLFADGKKLSNREISS